MASIDGHEAGSVYTDDVDNLVPAHEYLENPMEKSNIHG